MLNPNWNPSQAGSWPNFVPNTAANGGNFDPAAKPPPGFVPGYGNNLPPGGPGGGGGGGGGPPRPPGSPAPGGTVPGSVEPVTPSGPGTGVTTVEPFKPSGPGTGITTVEPFKPSGPGVIDPAVPFRPGVPGVPGQPGVYQGGSIGPIEPAVPGAGAALSGWRLAVGYLRFGLSIAGLLSLITTPFLVSGHENITFQMRVRTCLRKLMAMLGYTDKKELNTILEQLIDSDTTDKERAKIIEGFVDKLYAQNKPLDCAEVYKDLPANPPGGGDSVNFCGNLCQFLNKACVERYCRENAPNPKVCKDITDKKDKLKNKVKALIEEDYQLGWSMYQWEERAERGKLYFCEGGLTPSAFCCRQWTLIFNTIQVLYPKRGYISDLTKMQKLLDQIVCPTDCFSKPTPAEVEASLLQKLKEYDDQYWAIVDKFEKVKKEFWDCISNNKPDELCALSSSSSSPSPDEGYWCVSPKTGGAKECRYFPKGPSTEVWNRHAGPYKGNLSAVMSCNAVCSNTSSSSARSSSSSSRSSSSTVPPLPSGSSSGGWWWPGTSSSMAE